MEQNNNFKMILNNILEAKKSAIIIFDLDLNILYMSDMAKKLSSGKHEINKASEYFDDYDPEEYAEVIRSGKISDKKIKKINRNFYLSVLSPIIEKEKVVGIIEIFGVEDKSTTLSYEVKRTHLKAYEISEKANSITENNGTVYTLESIITRDEYMEKLISKAKQTANSSSPVLIYGETGTGKELFAQGIHNASPERRDNMFIAQNCAAIPETLLESLLFGTTEGSFTGAKDKPGLFEIADGGTIYLDEINSMDLNLQAKLLRVLQENTYMPIGGKKVKKSNVRIIASFNEEPISVIKKGRFRRDLYYRLNVIYLKIPSLEDRRDDIELLTNYFIKIYNKKFQKNVLGINREAMNILENSNWEGNVRELKNSIERIMNFVYTDYIKIEDISNFIIKETEANEKENSPELDKRESSSEAVFRSSEQRDGRTALINNHGQNAGINVEKEASLTKHNSGDEGLEPAEAFDANKTFNEIIEDMEIRIIRTALNQTSGNVASAARKLNLPRQTLKNKMDKYNIKPNF